MINRKQLYRVSFKDADRNQKIAAIKIIRRLTAMGLKEAKDLVEETMGTNGYNGDTGKSYSVPPEMGSSLIDLLDEHKSDSNPRQHPVTPGSLRELGATVTPVAKGAPGFEEDAIRHLRLALAAAALSQNDALTMDILLIIQKYAP